METIPVKKYRLRRARKWLSRTLVPFPIRAQAVAKKWQKPDRDAVSPEPGGGTIRLRDYEYSWLSQNGEDGVLRLIFDAIGYESRWLVEFGFGAKQCNALRMLVKEGFSGLLMDGSPENVDLFNYAARKHRLAHRAKAVQAFITRQNLENLITSHGVPHKIDLLSLDVDGNDFWFWESLDCISPRVICIEYNAGLGPERRATVPYDDEFERFSKDPSGFFYGASLSALEALGRHKGYYLIGCDSTGTNAFFLRNDLAIDGLSRKSASEAYRPHMNWLGRGLSESDQRRIMASMPYMDV